MPLAPTSRMHWAGTYDEALDYAAGVVVLQGGALYRARLLRPQGSGAPAGDSAHWDTLAASGSAPTGAPVLYGPYVVDYTDIPHDGDKKTLWTPRVGDVLLRLFADWQTVMQWDHKALNIGQNVDQDNDYNLIAYADFGHIGRGSGSFGSHLDTLLDVLTFIPTDATGTDVLSTATVFHTTDPVQIQLGPASPGASDTSGNPTQGHVELFALIARPVAP